MFGFRKEEPVLIPGIGDLGFEATRKRFPRLVEWAGREISKARGGLALAGVTIRGQREEITKLRAELEALQKDHKAYYDEASELRRKLITLTREYQVLEARLNRYRETEETISRREEIKDQVTEALIGLGLGTAKAGGCKCKK